MVVSTANHEFFGVSVVEAVSVGCVPLLPKRLSYPELIHENHKECLFATLPQLSKQLKRWILAPRRLRELAAKALRAANGVEGDAAAVPWLEPNMTNR